MSLRILWRVLGSIAVVGLLALIPALSLRLGAPPSAVTPLRGDESFAEDWWLDPVEVEDAEANEADAAEFADAGVDGGGSPAPDSGEPGTFVDLPGMSFQPGLRSPETQASLFAAVNAYRASRGIPAFLAGEPSGAYQCVWPGLGGTIWPGTISPSEPFARAIPRLFPAAVTYQGPPGSVTVGLVLVDSFIDSATGRVWPSETASIIVKHCFPPSPPPVEPSTPPVEPSTPPVEPSAPPSEPPAPPVDPSTAPSDPAPSP